MDHNARSRIHVIRKAYGAVRTSLWKSQVFATPVFCAGALAAGLSGRGVPPRPRRQRRARMRPSASPLSRLPPCDRRRSVGHRRAPARAEIVIRTDRSVHRVGGRPAGVAALRHEHGSRRDDEPCERGSARSDREGAPRAARGIPQAGAAGQATERGSSLPLAGAQWC